jgi:hypothetical protein
MKSKPILIVSAFVLAIASGCEDSVIGDEEPVLLRGQIFGWNAETYRSVLYISTANSLFDPALDSTAISEDGGFAIKLPFPVPPDSLLRKFVPEQLDSNEHISKHDQRGCSNLNAKYVELKLVLRDKRIGLRQPLYCGNTFVNDDSLSRIGDYRITYCYFSQPTTISGSYRITFRDTILVKEFRHSDFITDYNLNVTPGWNVIQTQITSDNNGTRPYTVSSTDAADKKWFAVYFTSRGFEFASAL